MFVIPSSSTVNLISAAAAPPTYIKNLELVPIVFGIIDRYPAALPAALRIFSPQSCVFTVGWNDISGVATDRVMTSLNVKLELAPTALKVTAPAEETVVE